MAQQTVDPATLDEMITLARTDELSRCALADALEEMGRVADAEDIRHAHTVAEVERRGEGRLSILYARWLIRRDLPDVEAIGPWDADTITKAIRDHDTIGMVIEHAPTDRVVAYVIYRLKQGHLSIRVMQVDSRRRQLGLAQALLLKLQSKLSLHRRTSIIHADAAGMCQEWYALHTDKLAYLPGEEFPS